MLYDEQLELLGTLVEAARQTPRDQRQPFRMMSVVSRSANYALSHPAIPRDHPGAYPGDVELLAQHGLIQVRYEGRHVSADVTPKGFEYYAEWKRQAGDPIEVVEREYRGFLDSAVLQSVCPEATAKWRQAEALLWDADSGRDLTAIGHYAREALQAFAMAMESRYHGTTRQADVAKTVVRIRALIAARVASDTTRAFAEALLAYWGTVSDLAQRQEHGASKEGEALTWGDARRLVFQTIVVMHEIHNALAEPAGGRRPAT